MNPEDVIGESVDEVFECRECGISLDPDKEDQRPTFEDQPLYLGILCEWCFKEGLSDEHQDTNEDTAG